MKLYTFAKDGGERLGVEANPGELVDLAAADPCGAFASMQALIEGGEAALDRARAASANAGGGFRHALDTVRVLAPLPRPSKIRGFSVFERHLVQATDGAARRMAAGEPDPDAAYAAKRRQFNLDSLPGAGWRQTPAYYYSDTATIVGQDEDVRWPEYSDWIDFELEILAVIGRPGRDIPRQRAGEYIFGYTLMNDLSARDAQFNAMATGIGFAKGKDFDKSNPLGPCIVTCDELPDPYALKLRTRVNGEQWSAVDDLDPTWRFDDCIAYASQSQAIGAGELFSTGCAPDCCSIELMRTVRRGDRVEIEADGIGVLRTRIV
jgi:2-keto-4-pentenoate hydratase/2-oxohepta-3-ene-1,7-dioic acid hydratase in catechol pathway